MKRDEALDALLDTIICVEERPTYAALSRWVEQHSEHAGKLVTFFAAWAAQEFTADEACGTEAVSQRLAGANPSEDGHGVAQGSGLLNTEGAFRLDPQSLGASALGLPAPSRDTPEIIEERETDSAELAEQLGRRLGVGRVGLQAARRRTSVDSEPPDDPPPTAAAARPPSISRTEVMAHGGRSMTRGAASSTIARPKP